MDIIALHRHGLSERAYPGNSAFSEKWLENTVGLGSKHPNTKKRRDCILAPHYKGIDDFKEDEYRATWIYQRIRQLGYAEGYGIIKIYTWQVKQKR